MSKTASDTLKLPRLDELRLHVGTEGHLVIHTDLIDGPRDSEVIILINRFQVVDPVAWPQPAIHQGPGGFGDDALALCHGGQPVGREFGIAGWGGARHGDGIFSARYHGSLAVTARLPWYLALVKGVVTWARKSWLI